MERANTHCDTIALSSLVIFSYKYQNLSYVHLYRRNSGSVYEKTVVGTQVKLDQLEQGTAYLVVVQLQKKETNGNFLQLIILRTILLITQLSKL